MSGESAVSSDTTLILPDEFQSRGFTRAGIELLETAVKRGKISTREIANIIPKGLGRNRELLSETMSWIDELLKAHNVRLLSDTEELEHRKKYPLRKPKPKFRKIQRTTNLPTTKEDGRTPDLLEEQGSRYEHDRLNWYYAEIGKFPNLPAEEVYELGRRIQNDHDLDARNSLVKHNLRLVRWVARKYAWSKLDFEDLVQEGNIGLITAAEKYDPERGLFTTYAMWWIRQAIQRAIQNHSETVRLPVHVQDLGRTIRKASDELKKETGKTPTVEEISVHTGIPSERIERIQLRLNSVTIYLDKEVHVAKRGEGSEGSGPSLKDSLPDEETFGNDLLIEAYETLEEARHKVNEALWTALTEIDLSERNQEIFKTFYGFDDSGKRRTLQYVGDKFEISRERVRQIIAQIWKKMDERGSRMDHDRMLRELNKIDELGKIVASVTG